MKSNFHPGEQAAQERVGMRDKMEIIGTRAIQDFMPDQHRMFYAQLPMMLMGAEDQKGDLWASVIFGEPGFVYSLDDTTLWINGNFHHLDPLFEQLNQGSELGLLGIDFETRRRNRVNTKVMLRHEQGFLLTVQQSFGNCPKYIQQRRKEPIIYENPESRQEIQVLTNDTICMIEAADTFFIATKFSDGDQRQNRGVDVSHRGGQPGFVKVKDEHTLLIPDYAGNNFFNTIGNLMLNSQAGLLFMDFSSGALLYLSGRAEVLWRSEESLPFEKVDRMIQFDLSQGMIIHNVIPYRWVLEEISPFSLLYSEG